MKKVLTGILLVICLLMTSAAFAQTRELTFPIYAGSPDLFTMKQTDDLFLSFFQLGTDLFYESNIEMPDTNDSVIAILGKLMPQVALWFADSYIFDPMVHEEAHRSILTAQGIGSISQPIINRNRVAYVKGVTDATLKNLRDTDLPTFIRLHTAGTEADYSVIQKEFQLFTFYDEEKLDSVILPPVVISYLLRVISMTSYEMNAYQSGGVDDPEEADELERDIVGDDFCGMIHHLYNPTAEYHRYWTTDSFSDEEMAFVKRIFYRTMLNIPIITPLTFHRLAFQTGEQTKLSFNTGYCLAPFGDFIDENIYFHIDDVLKGPLEFSFTARQYQNKDNWFPAFNVTCQRFSPLSWLTLTASGDIWWQPENLSFTTDQSFVGGSASLGFNVYPLRKKADATYDFGLNFDFMYKTKGFKPEIVPMDEAFVFTAGIAVRY